MNKEEIRQFIKSSVVEDLQDDGYDSSGNHWETKILKNGDKLYRLEFLNGTVCEFTGPKGIISGVYIPKEVVKTETLKEITEITYEDIS